MMCSRHHDCSPGLSCRKESGTVFHSRNGSSWSSWGSPWRRSEGKWWKQEEGDTCGARAPERRRASWSTCGLRWRKNASVLGCYRSIKGVEHLDQRLFSENRSMIYFFISNCLFVPLRSCRFQRSHAAATWATRRPADVRIKHPVKKAGGGPVVYSLLSSS